MISKDLDGGATEADGRASAPVGPSVATPLQQLCIESMFTDIPDSFMDMISSHGGLEHMILSVRSITIRGIYTVINNSSNLMSFCAFINQLLCNDNGRKVQSKDFKAKVNKEFGHHRLFTVGTFRVAVGNQFLVVSRAEYRLEFFIRQDHFVMLHRTLYNS